MGRGRRRYGREREREEEREREREERRDGEREGQRVRETRPKSQKKNFINLIVFSNCPPSLKSLIV